MSTRSSIYYANGLHLYEECLSEEVCLEVEGTWLGDNKLNFTKVNEKYGSLTMSREDWIDFAKHILKAVDPKGDSEGGAGWQK